MVTVTTPLIYVALWGEQPIGASTELSDVQQAVERHSPRNSFYGRTRWDETVDGNEWQLMSLSQETRRWRKASYVIRTAPLLRT